MTLSGVVLGVNRVGLRVGSLTVSDGTDDGSVVVMVPRSGLDKVVLNSGYESAKGLIGKYRFDLCKFKLVKDAKGTYRYWHPSLVGSGGKGVKFTLYHRVSYGDDVGYYAELVRGALDLVIDTVRGGIGSGKCLTDGKGGGLAEFAECMGLLLKWGKKDCGLGVLQIPCSVEGDNVVGYRDVLCVEETVYTRLVKVIMYRLGFRKEWNKKGFDVNKAVQDYCVYLDRVVRGRLAKVGMTGISKVYRDYVLGLVGSKQFYKCGV